MTPGYFFKPYVFDSHGIPLGFLYHIVRRIEPEGNYTDYPVCVSLHSDKIHFYLQSFGYPSQERVSDQKSKEKLPKSQIYQYSSEDLFTMSLDIVEIDSNTSTLSKFVENIEQSKSVFDNILDLKLYYKYRYSAFKTYIELEQKNPKNKNEHVSIWPGLPKLLSEKLSIYEVLLDFLFDFYETNTFRSHPLYNSISNKLRRHPVLGLIILKCRSNYENSINQLSLNLNSTQPNIDLIKDEQKTSEAFNIHLDRLIFDSDIDKHVNSKSNWFFSVEQEVKNLIDLHKPSFNPEAINNAIIWFLNRYHLWGGASLLFRIYFNGISKVILVLIPFLINCLIWGLDSSKILTLNLTWNPNILLFTKGLLFVTTWLFVFIITLVLERILSFLNILVKSIFRQGSFDIETSRWVESIQAIVYTFRPKILFASITAWIFVISTSKFWNLKFQFNSLERFIVAVLLIAATMYLVDKFQHLISENNNKLYVGKIIIRTSLILLLGMVYSFSIGCFMMTTTIERALTQNNYLQKYYSELYKEAIVEGKLSEIEDRSKQIDTNAWQKLDHLFLDISENGEQNRINDLSAIIKTNSLDKDLLDSVLPKTYLDTSQRTPILYAKSLLLTRIGMKKDYEVQILPQMLLFFTFIALVFSIFLELGIRGRLGINSNV